MSGSHDSTGVGVDVSDAEATAAIAIMALSPQRQQEGSDEESVNWDEIEEKKEGDDMYGDQLDSGWLSGQRGAKLIRESERLINTTLLRREGLERGCTWREVFSSLEIDLDSLKSDSKGEEKENSYNPADLMDIDVQKEEEEEGYTPFNVTILQIKTMYKDAIGKPMGGNALSAICLRFGPAFAILTEALESTYI